MMEDTIEQSTPVYMPLSQWFVVAGGVLIVAIPWWIGLLYMIGVL